MWYPPLHAAAHKNPLVPLPTRCTKCIISTASPTLSEVDIPEPVLGANWCSPHTQDARSVPSAYSAQLQLLHLSFRPGVRGGSFALQMHEVYHRRRGPPLRVNRGRSGDLSLHPRCTECIFRAVEPPSADRPRSKCVLSQRPRCTECIFGAGGATFYCPSRE